MIKSFKDAVRIGNMYINSRGHILTIMDFKVSDEFNDEPVVTFSYNDTRSTVRHNVILASTFLMSMIDWKRYYKIKNMPKEEL